MALQFLPAEYIPAQFGAIEAAGPPPTTSRLLAYYRTQWLENRMFPAVMGLIQKNCIRIEVSYKT